MVSFVVDDDDVLRAGHVFKDFADVGLVAECAALVYAFPFGNALLGIPIETVPIGDAHATLAKRIFQSSRNETEFLVVVGRAGNQDLQAILNRKAGSNDENVFGEALVLWGGNFVENLPGDEHGHDDGLARAGGHLGTEAGEVATVGRDIDSITI